MLLVHRGFELVLTEINRCDKATLTQNKYSDVNMSLHAAWVKTLHNLKEEIINLLENMEKRDNIFLMKIMSLKTIPKKQNAKYISTV